MSRATDDWRDVLYLSAFLDLSLSDGVIERRDQVWIKRFLENRGKPQLYRRMEAIIRAGRCDADEYRGLVERGAAELPAGEKRRFVYNLAQLVKSKGTSSTREYGKILDLAERLGVPDTEADAMIHSVHRINDTFIAILGLLACGTIIYLTRTVIIPLVIAVFITMIVNRIDGAIASVLNVRRLRWFTKLGAMLAILAILFGLVMAAIVSGTDIANRYPEYEARFDTALRDSETAQRALAWLDGQGILEQLRQLPVGDNVRGLLTSLLGLLSNFVLVVVYTGFLVASSSAFTGVLADMNRKMGTYIATKSLVCLITGLTVYLLCRLFGIDFALFWALLAFLLNFIPVVGAIVASLPPILLAFVQLDSDAASALFLLCMILANVLLGQVLEPKLMGKRLAIKPVAILLGLVFWGFLWGIPGMFLATPLMVLLGVLSSHFNFSRSYERLVSTETT
jgi:AI-2 transport protein TqsA